MNAQQDNNMNILPPRLCIGAASSSSGKTTLVCGIMRAFIKRDLKVVAFKCGPDYIDPMFHRRVVGAPSTNLDGYFFDAAGLRRLLGVYAQESTIAVIEGVMGYYDGLGGVSTDASTWSVAVETKTPTVLIIDCKGLSSSAAAIAKGFACFKEQSQIAGIILNRMVGRLYEDTKALIEQEVGVPVLGYMPYLKACSIESRHLGLVTASEIEDLQTKIDTLAAQAEKTIDLDALVTLATSAPPVVVTREPLSQNVLTRAVRIGIARDDAFCFYYEDGLKALEELGATLVPFSPLRDSSLPENLSGLYLGGGYPELYLPELAGNKMMLAQIQEALNAGLPCIAECGGFMYLHEQVFSSEGEPFTLVGALTGRCVKTSRLVRFGYAEYKVQSEGLLAAKGDIIKGHEFHYWESSRNDDCFSATKPFAEQTWTCALHTGNLYAGFPHIHLGAHTAAAQRFIEACSRYEVAGGEGVCA